jgi:HEAT repeat protein
VYFHQADSLSITLAVANCLRDPDPQVRQLAAALLCEPRHRTPLVVRDLTSCLQDHDPDVLIFACQAILALGVRTTDACPALLQLTNDPRPDVRCAARAAAALVQG